MTIGNTTGKVEFSENAALLEGGAIAAYDAPVTMEKNGSILFKGNTAELGAGGAIYIFSSDSTNDAKCTVTIKGTTTGAVEFIDNSAKIHGGAIRTSGSVEFIDNKDVTFSGNSVVQSSTSSPGRGGAIYAGNGKVTINDNNGIVTFSGNAIDSSINRQVDSTFGGAIYAKNLDMHNNASVIFEKNLELRNVKTNGTKQYRLRSLHITGDASLSVASGNKIEFYDSVYIGGNLTLNATYNNLDQTGDVLFTGENTIADLTSTKKGTPSDDEIQASRTSTVSGKTDICGGRLRVENEAVFLCDKTITLAEGTGATLLVKDATVKAGAGSSEGHIYVNKGTSVILEGSEADSSVNHARINNQVWLLGGSSDSYSLLNVKGYATIGDKVRMEKFSEMVLDGHLSVKGYVSIGDINSKATINFLLAESHRENAALNVTQNLYFDIGAQLTLGLDLASDAEEGRYRLITDHSANPTAAWVTEQNLTVWGLGAASSASFADLQWENGTLYYNLEMLQWTNATGNGLWDTKTMNWQAGRTYTDGRNVKFADDGVGEVFLSGDLEAGTVSVTNSTGEYVFTAADNGGRLAGDTILVKNGAGALTLASANAHTGPTQLKEGTLNLHHSDALGTSTLTADVGTTLGVGNNAHVVLNQAGHSIAGNVLVDADATLEIKGDAGSAIASTFKATANGTLTFTNTAVSIKGPDGSGAVRVVNSQVTLSSHIAGFKGELFVVGSDAKLSLDPGAGYVYAAINIEEGMLNGSVQLMAGASINLASDATSGKYATLISSQVYINKGATLSARLLNSTGAQNITTLGSGALNSTIGGVVKGGLSLTSDSVLVLDKSHIDLDGGKLRLEWKTVKLDLTTDGELFADSMVVLFSGVDVLYTGMGTDTLKEGSYSAQDYFSGVLIDENTMMTYLNGVVSLSGLAIPEPSAFSLLAGLGALALVATHRRRRK